MRALVPAAVTLTLIVAGCTATPSALTPSVGAASPSLAPARAPTVAEIARSPEVPPPVGRTAPARVSVTLETREVTARLSESETYGYWTFGGTVPGPFLRVREGDTVEIRLRNAAGSSATHSIDLHAVSGPGGGAGATQVAPGGEKSFTFKALNPGLYVYHCATPPIPMHLANGMYGLILVEPAGGLPPVDREFALVQGELYTAAPRGIAGHQEFSYEKMLNERPEYVVFNGRPAGLTGEKALKARVGERVRIYFGVGGYLTSSLHVIGEIFDRVYPEGAIGSAPLQNVQTTLVPAGGAAIVELTPDVPGTYVIVDHALPRALDRGAVAQLVVEGPANPSIFDGTGGSGH